MNDDDKPFETEPETRDSDRSARATGREGKEPAPAPVPPRERMVRFETETIEEADRGED